MIGDDGDLTCYTKDEPASVDVFSTEFLWPRALLLGCSVLYVSRAPLPAAARDRCSPAPIPATHPSPASCHPAAGHKLPARSHHE